MFRVIFMIVTFALACDCLLWPTRSTTTTTEKLTTDSSTQPKPSASTTQNGHGSFNKYFIYTRTNPRFPVELNLDVQESIDTLSKDNRTIVIAHGYEGSAITSLNPTVKDAALQSEDFNIIVLDWSVYAGQSYTNAVNSVPDVGRALGKLINELVTREIVSLSRLHLIGFDLGAHVMAFAGRELNGNVARITGLNPSGSQWGTNSQRLTFNDALYVEVIHTDGIGPLANGIGDAVGHADFYPNGGTGQPGCFLNHKCSHNRSWELMAATFTNNHLIANRCGSWYQVTMNLCRGYQMWMGNSELVKQGSGMFRVNTKRTYPF
ncbi:lipase member H-like [Bicyclus anynana]|uniref:Lipase member H-like n=1 Tax=Bicyclus anynana TaxID=110368 RepID=A0A6J1MRE8_BICAN|nr:lipase member H-like [Bicyclus anynana]